MIPTEHEPDDAAGFTLDPSLLAERRAAGERRMHTVQIPMVRAVGFIIVCVLVTLDDWRIGASLAGVELRWLIVCDLLYAGFSWPLLRSAYVRGKVGWSLLFLHLDVLMSLLDLSTSSPVRCSSATSC